MRPARCSARRRHFGVSTEPPSSSRKKAMSCSMVYSKLFKQTGAWSSTPRPNGPNRSLGSNPDSRIDRSAT